MTESDWPAIRLLGLFEIDIEANILYVRSDAHQATLAELSLYGKNFYDLAPAKIRRELQEQIQRFVHAKTHADRFYVSAPGPAGKDEQLKVLLGRIRSADEMGQTTTSVLVHLRRV